MLDKKYGFIIIKKIYKALKKEKYCLFVLVLYWSRTLSKLYLSIAKTLFFKTTVQSNEQRESKIKQVSLNYIIEVEIKIGCFRYDENN